MEIGLIYVSLMILLGFFFFGIIAVKFIPRTEHHLRFGSLLLDSFADAIALMWFTWAVGRMLHLEWLNAVFELGWIALPVLLLITLLLIPVNRGLIRHRLYKQRQKTQVIHGG